MTRGCRFATVLALFVVLLLPLLDPGPGAVPRLVGAQETTQEANADCGASEEPNDEPVDAQKLPDITACIAAEHDEAGQDFYRWAVSEGDAGRRWTIATTGITNQAISVLVYHSELDASGVVVDQLAVASADGGAGQGASLTNLLWPAGEYLIGVATSGAGSYQIAITAGDPAPEDEESEPNDDATVAQPLTGEFGLTGDRTETEDWFAWQIPDASEGQLWRLSAQFPLQAGGALRLYREDQTPLFDGAVGPDGRAVLDDIGLPAGTYLISVLSVTDASGTYILEAAPGAMAEPGGEQEPNDTLASAQAIEIGEDTPPISGRLATITDTTDRDIYGLTVDGDLANRQIDIRVFWEGEIPRDLCLLDSLEQQVRCQTSEPGQSGIAFNDLVLPEGEYGIAISGEPAPDVPYLLRFDVTIEPVASFEAEPNDAVEFANPFDVSGDDPTIQGRLSGTNYDTFRLTVTGEPQLWEITASGPGIGRLDVLNAVGSSDVSGTLGDGTSTISDVYLLPGDHFISIQGEGAAEGEYTIQATPLGPPDPAAEREPNNLLDRSQPIRLGEERNGRLIDTNDVDVYRFSLQNAGRVMIDLEVPPEVGITMDLAWSGRNVARMISAEPGDSLHYDATLPPGDYSLWLSPTAPGPERYALRIDPADPLSPPDDAEPNDDPEQARTLPEDGTVRGVLDSRLNNGADVDYFVMAPLEEASEARLLVDGDVTVELITPATAEFAETSLPLNPGSSENRFDVELPPDTPILVHVSGSGKYRISLRPENAGGGLLGGLGGLGGSEGEPGGIGLGARLGLDIDLDLGDAPVAAYLTDGQRIEGEVTLTNSGDDALDLTLDAVTGHHAWRVEFAGVEEPEVTLDGGESRTVPVSVLVAPDAWAGQPVLVTVRAATEAGQRTASATVVPDGAAPPLNPERWAPLPSELLGGLNVAWAGLGGAAVNPLSVDTVSSESELFNGVSPTGYAWKGDVASLPLELTVDLAGDEPVPVAGITLLTLNMDGFAGEGLRAFDLEFSLDGVTFEPALSAELASLPVEQAFVLDRTTEARYARLRVRSATIASASYATISEWAVIAEPGWTLPDPALPDGLDDGLLLDIGAFSRGGHVVAMTPQLYSSLDFQGLAVVDGVTVQTLTVAPGEPVSWTIGFRDNRAAQLDSLAWVDLPGDNPDQRLNEVLVEISVDGPTGPWTTVGTWELEREPGEEPVFTFDEPTWARFVRLTGSIDAPDETAETEPLTWELPDAVRVRERAPDDEYRSILGEWGLFSRDAIYERLVAPPAVPLDPDAGDNEDEATPLDLGEAVNDTAWVGQDEDWYEIEAPEDENGLAFTLTGLPSDPTVDVEVALFDEDGDEIDLDAGATSPRETVYTAPAEPGETYRLRVTEPPSSVIFAFDTSFSIGPYTTTVFQGLYRYAGDVRAGQEAGNIYPFGASLLLPEFADDPYVLQSAVTNYPQTASSSDAEGALIAALDAMEGRDGTAAVVIVTDAATTPSPDELLRLWPGLAGTAPRIFAVHISGGENPELEQHLMQDWAAVNNGIYSYVVTQGEMDVAFDRAAATLRRPAGYGLSVAAAEIEEPTPEPTNTPEPTQTPEPEPTETPEPEPAEDGSIRVLAPPAGEGQEVPAAADASVALILDTSGSMLQPLEGGTRTDVAKAALIDLVTNTLPPGTRVSLRAFGVVPDSCDTRLVVPQTPLDPEAMVATIQGLEVVNLVRTPLGASLEAVAVDLGRVPGPKIVVFVTDGEETCGGDSAAAIQALVDSGIDVRVNIVGFALDDEALKAQFEEWARIGHGRYIDAGNQAELTAAVAEAVLPVYRILDEEGDPIGTGQVGGGAVPVPPGTYTIEISGSPRVRIGDVEVTSGEETVVGLDDDEGSSGSGAPIGLAGVVAVVGVMGVVRARRATP